MRDMRVILYELFAIGFDRYTGWFDRLSPDPKYAAPARASTCSELSNLFDPEDDVLVALLEFVQHFCQPLRIVLFRINDILPARAARQARTVCTICPTPASTESWNLPCIWPIISSLSSRSAPASTRMRAVRVDKNLLDSPVNQPNVKGQRNKGGNQKRESIATRNALSPTCPVWRGVAERSSPNPW